MNGRAAALAAFLAVAGPTRGADVIVDVAGVLEAVGEVRVALYADEAGFDAREAVGTRVVTARSPSVGVVFDGVPPGNYALLAFHDVDGDGVLRRGAFGVPAEPWTGSTGGSRFRAPSWRAYAVAVPATGLTLELAF